MGPRAVACRGSPEFFRVRPRRGRGREMAPGGPRGLSASDAGRTPCAPVGPASPPQRAGVPAPGGVACWSPPGRTLRPSEGLPGKRPAAHSASCGLRPAPAPGSGAVPRGAGPVPSQRVSLRSVRVQAWGAGLGGGAPRLWSGSWGGGLHLLPSQAARLSRACFGRRWPGWP